MDEHKILKYLGGGDVYKTLDRLYEIKREYNTVPERIEMTREDFNLLLGGTSLVDVTDILVREESSLAYLW